MQLKSLISTTAILAVVMIMTPFTMTQASEHLIATVSSDQDNAIIKLIVEAEDGRDIKAFYKDIIIGGVKVYRASLDPKELLETGMVLDQRGKHVIFKLKSDDFNLQQGGMIVADTLYNGATGQRKSYTIQLAQGKVGWSLYRKGKSIKEISIQTNKVMILGVVGIKNLVMK